jgi:ABC-type bacteriocin/lantibiotic exporter with double-glycine peptidase domain
MERLNWWGACQRALRHEGVSLPYLPPEDADSPQAIAISLGIRWRAVTLNGEWWWQAGPTLVTTYQGRPVALLGTGHGYRLYDPDTQRTQPMTPALADACEPHAVQFYAPLPNSRSVLSLLRWSVPVGDINRIGIALLMVAALQLVLPLVTQVFFDTLIPLGLPNLLLPAIALLLTHLIALALMYWVVGETIIRLNTRMSERLHAAVWDQVLALPTSFFRAHPVGDLQLRTQQWVAGLQGIMSAALNGVLSLAVLIVSLIMLVYYNLTAAFWLGALGSLYILVMCAAGILSRRYQQRFSALSGERQAQTYQAIRAIVKLRAATAENRIIVRWARLLEAQRVWLARDTRLRNVLQVLALILPLLGLALFFLLSQRYITLGELIVFNLLMTTFMGAVVRFGNACFAALAAYPLYERGLPLLQNARTSAGTHAAPLNGDITCRDVTFTYSGGSTPVLINVNFAIPAGGSLGIIGPSGSGKSTLLRVLMGLETPEFGTILYDGRPTADWSAQSLREQIGFVAADSTWVGEATLLSHLANGNSYPTEAVWEALEWVGLAETIRTLPMALQTLIGESGLSSGQRQQLLLARALLPRPRLLVLDEATSHLDRPTQARLNDQLRQLGITRIIVTHRLSALAHVDQVLVMMHGKVIEQGTPDELRRNDGYFNTWETQQRH